MIINRIKFIGKCIVIVIIFFIIYNVFVSSRYFAKTNKTIQLNINYVLPEYIYNSKDELFNDFFFDFYNYISAKPSGPSHLKSYNIKNVDDLYNICKYFDKKNATGFPHVGDILAPYFLYQRRGSNFEEQKNKDYFIGYCLRNGKYVAFFNFLEKFFYYYRMDEGYTGPASEGKDPYGSDFFASPYASIIDTVKFFYYTKYTLPSFFYDNKNIPDLYDKIPGILKTPFDKNVTISYDTSSSDEYTLPANFDCYAYKFDGWYTNSNFNSSPISHIDSTYITINNINEDNNTITLYAKFISVP